MIALVDIEESFLLVTLFYFLVTLGILVAVHEFGHFWVARKLGVKVLTFSIGFGRPLFQRTDASGTRYVLAAIPLGGFVSMLDEREAEVAPELQKHAFNRQSLRARAAIILAGPMANFLLAIAVYWAVSVIGVQGYQPVVGEISSGSAAERAGLFSDQLIVAIDGKPVRSRAQVNMALLQRVGDTGKIEIATSMHGSNVANSHSLDIERWLSDSEMQAPSTALGFEFWQPEWPAIIDKVVSGQAAAKAGLLSGDKLVVVAGQPVAVWQDAVELIRTSPNQALNIEIERDGARQPIQLTPAAHSLASGEIVGRIGVSVALPEMPANMQVLVRSGIVEGLWVASKETVSMIAFTLNSIKKMLAGLISTDNLSGPVTIAKIASASAASGLTPYLQFLALISISLGVINLLPIPVLDGGQLVMLGAEAVTGKPLPERVMQFVQQVGLMLILSIMALALYNDFTRL